MLHSLLKISRKKLKGMSVQMSSAVVIMIAISAMHLVDSVPTVPSLIPTVPTGTERNNKLLIEVF